MSKCDDADEYIKRDTALNELICAVYWALNQHGNVTGQVIIDRFNAIPPADVQPVVHGEWVTLWSKEDPYTSVECRCSACDRVSARPVGSYCKWCGAKMDGE